MPVAGAVMLIAAGPFAVVNRTVLSNRFMVGIGLISFPLYLWHWPLLSFARIIKGIPLDPVMRGGAIVLSVVLAWLTYRLMEVPLKRRSGRAKPLKLCALLAGMGLVGFYTFDKAGLPERPIDKGSDAVTAQFVGSYWAYMRSPGCEARHPYPAASEGAWWFCMDNKDTPPTLMLIGTSFANQLFPGLAKNPATQGHSILSIGTCDPASPDITTDPIVPPPHPCFGDRPLKQKQMIKSLIDQAATVEYAIISGLSEDPDADYGDRLERYIAELEEKHVKVIVFLPHIQLWADPRSCYSRPLGGVLSNCVLSWDRYLEINAQYAPIISRIGQSHPEVRFFDQKALTCGDGKCWAVLDGMPLYRDWGHLSEYASIRMAELFVEWAKVNAPGILKN